MITFHNVKWKNFLSTGNKFSSIDIDDAKTTLMIGINGSGKSTFMDAISFGLFGKPFRKVKIGQLVNSINRKNMVVELSFSTGGKKYLIRRGLKPVKFDIWVDGEEQNQSAAIRDQQDYLEKYILKMNEKSFRQIVVLGSGSFVPFMRLPAGDRRSIIEELLDIQIFGVMNDLVRERLSTTKSDLSDISHQIDLLEQNIKQQEEHLKSINEDKQAKIDKKKSFIDGYMNEIAELVEQIDDLKKTTVNFNKMNAQHSKYLEFQSTFDAKIVAINNQLNLFNTNEICPSCSQDIDKKHKEGIETELNKKNKKLIKGLSDVRVKINDISQDIGIIQNTLNDISNKQNQITNLNDTCTRINVEIADAMKEKMTVMDNEDLNQKKELNDTQHATKYNLHENQHNLTTVQDLLKDSGIKTVVIRNYLPLINQLINKYLNSLNFYINFQLDENFIETIKSRGRDEFAYGSFSEGEKLRIDLALLFTWREIAKVKSSVATNLLILDEIFDSSLDGSGIEDFLGILNSLDNNCNAFVISHKGHQIIDKFGKVIKIVKNNNFSALDSY